MHTHVRHSEEHTYITHMQAHSGTLSLPLRGGWASSRLGSCPEQGLLSSQCGAQPMAREEGRGGGATEVEPSTTYAGISLVRPLGSKETEP